MPWCTCSRGQLEASHYWQLFKTMRTGSWAKTGYRAPHSPERTLRRMLYQDGLRVGLRVRSFGQWNTTDLEYFIFRCEVARTYWRDHFAGLMGSRVELLISGCKRQKVCDYLGISRESLKWLDKEIRKFVRLPRTAVRVRDYLSLRRKWKHGDADRLIRQRKHGYKQAKVPEPQQVDPVSKPLDRHI